MLLLTVAEALRRERVAEALELAMGPAVVGLLGQLPAAVWRSRWRPAGGLESLESECRPPMPFVGPLEGALRRREGIGLESR